MSSTERKRTRLSEREKLTERVQFLMAPSEVAAVDQWAWERKIRTRGEALRQMVARVLTEDEPKPAEKRPRRAAAADHPASRP